MENQKSPLAQTDKLYQTEKGESKQLQELRFIRGNFFICYNNFICNNCLLFAATTSYLRQLAYFLFAAILYYFSVTLLDHYTIQISYKIHVFVNFAYKANVCSKSFAFYLFAHESYLLQTYSKLDTYQWFAIVLHYTTQFAVNHCKLHVDRT